MTDGDGTWQQYQRLVLSELERLNGNLEAFAKRQAEQDVEIALMKQKAGVWGALGGAVPVLVAILVMLVREVFFK